MLEFGQRYRGRGNRCNGDAAMARILVIDDDYPIRVSLRSLLEQMGHVVREASNGSSGMKFCSSESFDLVITDIYMPVLNGLETIALLRRWGLTMPILAMSESETRQSQDVLKLAIEKGANMTLLKPYTQDEIRTAVNVLLSRYSLQDLAPRREELSAPEQKPRSRDAQG